MDPEGQGVGRTWVSDWLEVHVLKRSGDVLVVTLTEVQASPQGLALPQ